jgi:hypothetical protein
MKGGVLEVLLGIARIQRVERSLNSLKGKGKVYIA